MGKKWLYLLMAIISTMLVVLIVIQVMWLIDASKAQQREKELRVSNALNKLGSQLANNGFCFESFGKVFVDIGDRFYMLHENKSGTTDTVGIYYDEAFTRDKKKVGFENSLALGLPFSMDIQMKSTVVSLDTTGYLSEKDAFYEQLNGTRLTDIIRNKKRIDSLFDMNFVDSLIKLNMALEKVDTAFGFGLIKADNKEIVYKRRVTDTAALMHTPYQVALFTENRFMEPYQLALVFTSAAPVFTTNSLLLLSIAVIVLLTFSFYAFVRTYLRQTELSQMKTDFIHNLTHEFNTPMANISLALETLDTNGKEMDIKTRNVINIIATESSRLRENIERSLQVAVMEDGALLMHKEEVDLVQLVNAVITAYALQCEALGGKISFVSTANPIVFADETHMLNCMVNLLDNAIKYRNSEPPVITVALQEKSGEAILSVSDNGIGMGSDTLKHIFDKFYRAHEGDTHNTKGFGLGLSYVKGIISAHGGTIEVTSKKGVGTKFIIRIPITTACNGK